MEIDGNNILQIFVITVEFIYCYICASYYYVHKNVDLLAHPTPPQSYVEINKCL